MVSLVTIAFSLAAFGCCVLGGDSQYDDCINGTVADIGNGRCDKELNVPSCGYDGGDCCSCTCISSSDHSCLDNTFDCIFPDCDGASTTSGESTCVEGWKNDGECDFHYNLGPECDYDGGDCCECSCVDTPDYACGTHGFYCEDPACFDPALVAEFPDCTGGWLLIGDGVCHAEVNIPSCGYDGGDCCRCSCLGSACSSSTFFDCVDPNAEDIIFECKAPPPAILPCPVDVQRVWVVDTPAQAQAFATAVYCSGGSFEVVWRGSVTVNEPIFVADGTVVAVTGADPGAVIDGNAATQLFTVINAVLSLSNVNVSNGVGMVGGAIAASGSTLRFNGTNFVGNRATQQGGGLYVANASNVSCFEVSFSDNTAEVNGGAMFVTGRSVVSCGCSWVNNSAGDAGGALSVFDESTMVWSDDAVFVSNTAGEFGGAIFVRDGSIVSWSSSTSFESNAAGLSGGAMNAVASRLSWNSSTEFRSNGALTFHGGALSISAGSTVSWNGATTYVNNTAVGDGGTGGALHAWSSVVAWRGPTSFVKNEAGLGGGAVYLEASHVSWSGETTTVFDRNRAGSYGGGVAALLNSSISCSEDATSMFLGNSARESGGAIALDSGSSLAFSGNSSLDGNRAGDDSDSGPASGGGIYLHDSTATWSGLMSFTGNKASSKGGAVYVILGVVWCGGETRYLSNIAEETGGGVYTSGSILSWDGEVEFFNNTAASPSSYSGGGVAAVSSEVSWTGRTTVNNNHVEGEGGGGGGFSMSDGSVFTWTGDTEFTDNKADLGGAILTINGSRVSWNATSTTFNNNSAEVAGGGLFVADSAEVSWSGDTEYSGNQARSGGAVFVLSGSSVGWTGATTFSSNVANADGGAVGSSPDENLLGSINSIIVINGSTSFSNNTSGANGGALALLGGWSVDIGTVDVVFSSNHAHVAGGAVFVSGAGFGPTFTNITFISNSAQVGGAASMMASGSLKDISETVPPSPTTFDRCWFIDNTATATGGAIESASGHDAIVGSVFQGNTAGTSGGALRLAGTASVDNCSFSENVSDDSGGPAISNIGVILKMQNVSFRHNVFACQPGMFLGFNASGNPYAVVCDGCQTACDGCSFEEPPMVPMCMAVMQHVFSDGGTDTLEVLSIERGYWRATPSSEDILACYNVDACLGGVTGTSGYCLEGYEGPYCSICSDGYTGGPVFTCSKCSSDAGGIALAAVLAVVVLLVAVAVAVYVMSGNTGVGSKGMIERLGRYIPLQSMKVIIVVWQILTQFTSVANVTYPDVYQRLVTGLDVFNFDLSWILSAGCVFNVDFHDQLLLSTIGPIVALLFLGGTYSVAARINRGDPEIVQVIWNKHVSMVLLLTFLVYSNVSSTLFKTFACEELADGKNYLRTDYRIECDSSRHEGLQVYAGLMIVLYTVGIPSLYGVLLFRDMDVLKRDQVDREENARIRSTSDLWKPYRPSVFYYEVIECGRRVLLAGVVVFIYPNTAAQIAVTLVIAFVFVVVSEALALYASRWDTWLSRMGHAVVFMSMYVALLLKVDVSDERADSQTVFEAVLVAAHACMILVIVVETVVLVCALRAEQREEPLRRFRPGKQLFRRKWAITSAKTNPFSRNI